MYSTDITRFAFNIWDCDSIQAVLDAAAMCNCEVILQTSSRIFEAMQQESIRYFVSYYSKKIGVNAFLHLDHCKSFGVIKHAVDMGWDSVMIDASSLPLEENIAMTNAVCNYAHQKGALVEAEVGEIHGVEEDIISEAAGVADITEISRFIRATDVDMFAAAIGTCHGIYKKKPNIHYDLIEQIERIVDKAFVIHGGSGLSDDDICTLLSYKNVRKINISTELKQAYRNGILQAEKMGALNGDGFEVTKVKKEIYTAIKAVAEHKMRLLG